jgi:hypothetical protein
MSACTRSSSQNDWSILFQVIPEHLTTNDSNINIIYYLLKQSHTPIFYESESGLFESHILKKWSRSTDNREYTLCPNSELMFNTSENLNTRHIEASLKKVKIELGVEFKITSDYECVHVFSKNGLPNLLKTLLDMRYAPTITCSTKWECGLGVYEVVEMNKNKIQLKRKTNFKKNNGFDTITLAKPEVLKANRTIQDINRTIEEKPGWIDLTKYTKFEVNLLQTVILIINSPKLDIRRTLFNCINSDELRKAFNPTIKNTEIMSIGSILPLEVYPISSHKENNVCASYKSNYKILNFINWRNNNEMTLSNFLAKLQNKTKIKVQNIDITPSAFVSALTSRNSDFDKFDLIPMAISAESTDFTSFFRPLIASSKKYLSYDISGAAEIYNQLIESVERRKSLMLARQLADLIKKNYVAIPMYQVKRSFYYPSNVKNLDTGRNFLEYPEVSKLEVH